MGTRSTYLILALECVPQTPRGLMGSPVGPEWQWLCLSHQRHSLHWAQLQEGKIKALQIQPGAGRSPELAATAMHHSAGERAACRSLTDAAGSCTQPSRCYAIISHKGSLIQDLGGLGSYAMSPLHQMFAFRSSYPKRAIPLCCLPAAQSPAMAPRDPNISIKGSTCRTKLSCPLTSSCSVTKAL